MKIEFLNKDLLKLFTTGKSKKYRLEQRIVRQFFEVVASIQAAKDIYDLWNEPSLKFEKLQGHDKRHSLRISHKYRLEVEIEWQNEEQTIGIVGIDEISNHYG